jgi:hypothetical protein
MFRDIFYGIPFAITRHWYRPQVDFLSDQTKIWKFEYGLGQEFISWLSSIVGMNLKLHENVDYFKVSDEGNKLVRTQRLEDNIREVYRKDFEVLY